jgi:hypothetical protein
MTEDQLVNEPRARTTIRFPHFLHQQLAKLARANHRSLNSQLLVMLEAGVEARQAERIFADTLVPPTEGYVPFRSARTEEPNDER